MKKSPLIRRTGLRRTSPHRPWRRAEDNKVDPAEAQYVLARDESCVAAKIDPEHRCEGRCTLDHVPEANRNALGKRARCSRHDASDRCVLLVLCWGANVNGCASAHRVDEREYLARVEPA